ncbi:HNH endonuclease signature motif containing protein [Halalkalibacterium halodurans]|uniref:HNH endonuclease n=1 Tax=Halalkalibacterium halodurans TaxID=86665 RepID=UPI002E20CC73|nr:HNH endonuclease signature motif containing protein [Halalkalibacterium halodurans]MED4105530.1 HNH endonuclease signature motif containing protein [Halalkalibacterium halodurans]MED4109264.1 HNH endonuclease signature motif containing protein [Halalkalibacterium halodurans]MED4149722.1 HNH endonuclease signature motif containing protein [Halalkalibacterium halodurans]
MRLDLEPIRRIDKPKHKRRAQKRAERGKFSKMIRDEIKKECDGLCQECGKRGHHLHHVMPKSRGGRGVKTNALLLCNECHKNVHADNARLKYWIEEFRKRFGKNFYKDREDLEREAWEKTSCGG